MKRIAEAYPGNISKTRRSQDLTTRSVDAPTGLRRQPEWEGGDSTLGVRLPPPTSASRSRNAAALDLNERGGTIGSQPVRALVEHVNTNSPASEATDAPGGVAHDVRCEIAIEICPIGQVQSCHISVTLVVRGTIVATEESAVDNVFVTEPALIPDTFATGILPLERADGCVRITYYAARLAGIGGSSVTEHVVVSRLIIPEACLIKIALTARLSYKPLAEPLRLDA